MRNSKNEISFDFIIYFSIVLLFVKYIFLYQLFFMPLQSSIHESHHALSILQEHKEIKKLLQWGIKRIFKWITLWILENTQESDSVKPKIQDQANEFEKALDSNDIIPAYAVREYIHNVSEWVWNILAQTQYYTEKGIADIKEILKYRSFIYWVLQLLEKSWFKVNSEKKQKKLHDVPSRLAIILSDILRDRGLSTLLMVLKSYGLIDLSGNQINNYEIEEEVKVLNINKAEVIWKLEALGAKKVFEWEVEDDYYDYPEWQRKLDGKLQDPENGIKSTFRIRKKTDKKGNIKYYYTVKRKLTKEEEKAYIDSWVLQEQTGVKTRRCFEKELEIKDFKLFQKIISNFWLVKVRSKKKERISYSLEDGNIKFDFDAYSGKQDMMEIEASKYEFVWEYIKKLWLENHKTMASGSEKFLNSAETDI